MNDALQYTTLISIEFTVIRLEQLNQFKYKYSNKSNKKGQEHATGYYF